MTRRYFPMVALAGCALGQTQRGGKLDRDYSGGQPKVKVDPAILEAGDRAWQQVEPGLRRKTWFNDRLTMVLIEFTKIPGKPPAPLHHHPHDQITYVVEGRIKAVVGDQSREVGPGGVFIVPSNVSHGVELVTDRVVLLDVFTPTREDFRA